MAIVKVLGKFAALVAAGLVITACSSTGCGGSGCVAKCDPSPYCKPTYIAVQPERIK